MGKKRRDVERTGSYFVFVPPLLSLVHSHTGEQAILSGCGLFTIVSSGSVHLPANVRVALFFTTGSHVQDFP